MHFSSSIQENNDSGKFIQGLNTKYETFIKAIWPWLSLLFLLALLSLLFLIFTILNSSRDRSRIWKSSSLATLKDLDAAAHFDLGELDRISELDGRAENIIVMLECQEDCGWKLVKTIKQG
jgi:hypothetical protein